MKGKIVSKADVEIEILLETVKDPIIKDFIPEILALVEKFGNSGQSGGSAPYVASAISQAVKKLCLQEPICDITGHEKEWSNPLGVNDDSCIQNKRCYAIFKTNKGSYYLDAITFKTQKGTTWSGTAKLSNGETIKSRQYIKGFPFKPKTFIIDVIEEEINQDDWEFTVKDETQLIDVFEYYKNPLKTL